MDLRNYSERTETKFPVHARTEKCQSNQARFARTEQYSEEGDPEFVRKTSYRKSTCLPSRERILLHLLHGSQKDGGFRPILNLKNLNTYRKVPHFKMEIFRSFRLAVKVGVWTITLDLRDA